MVLLDTPFGGYHGPDLLSVLATSSARRFLASIVRFSSIICAAKCASESGPARLKQNADHFCNDMFLFARCLFLAPFSNSCEFY